MSVELKHSLGASVIYSLQTKWWFYTFRGLISLMLGIISLLLPITTITGITVIFGAYTIAHGIFDIIYAISKAHIQQWREFILPGILGLMFGTIMLIAPQIVSISVSVLLWLMIAGWALLIGAFEFDAAIRLRQDIQNEWFLIVTSLILIIFGGSILFLLWFYPSMSMISLGVLIGFTFLAVSVTQFLLSFKLFKIEKCLI